MRLKNNIGRKKNMLASFRKAESGTVLPLFGLAIFAIVGATGIAIDYGRAAMMQSKLHAAIDAAGLAAGAVSYSRDVNTEVLKFAEANFPQGFMGVTYTVTSANGGPVNVDGSGNIDVTARGEISTTFMNIFGIRSLDIAATTQVARGNRRGLEVVMVLDNSGSMGGTQGGVTRSQAMVNGAKEFLNIVYDPESNLDPVYIGIVPFNAYVRPGAAKASGTVWSRESATDDTTSTDTLGCLNDRDDSPHTERPTAYVETDQPPTTENYDTLWNRDKLGGNCVADMFPMSSSSTLISNKLDTMTANGNTRVDLGAIWGWRMISPRWRGLWAHEISSLPLDYNSNPLMSKVVILLTDGENYPADTLLTSVQTDQRQIRACNSMKAAGITVYGITFHTTNARAISTMRSCASSAEHYFHAAGNDSIATVFQQIAESLVNLRISR